MKLVVESVHKLMNQAKSLKCKDKRHLCTVQKPQALYKPPHEFFSLKSLAFLNDSDQEFYIWHNNV